MMKTFASLFLLHASTMVEAFAPNPFPATMTAPYSSTALNDHINTRKHIEEQEMGIWPTSCRDDRGEYVPCEAISGHERRAMWEHYAPPHGTPTSYGTIGCPGGGDWCYASSYGAAQPIPENYDTRKKAATVAAALAGLGSGVGGATTDGVGISIKKGGDGKGDGLALPSASSGGSMALMGEDIRNARGSYARLGALGEIGASGGSSGPPPARAAFPSAGGLASSSGPSPPKTYGLGSWKPK